MFKWICLAVATLGLAAFLWMVNDVRLKVTGLTERVDAKLPALEEKAGRVDGKLTTLLADSNQAVSTINARLPRIMDKTEQSVDNLAQLSEDLKQSKLCREPVVLGPGAEAGHDRSEERGLGQGTEVGRESGGLGQVCQPRRQFPVPDRQVQRRSARPIDQNGLGCPALHPARGESGADPVAKLDQGKGPRKQGSGLMFRLGEDVRARYDKRAPTNQDRPRYNQEATVGR